MEEYINTHYLKSTKTLNTEAIERFTNLLQKNEGIEDFRITPQGIYLEYNTYISSIRMINEFLTNNGFQELKDQKPGLIKRQILSIAKSNLKQYGNHKPDCCKYQIVIIK